MYKRTWVTVAVLCGTLAGSGRASAAPAEVEALLRAMPGDVPLAGVILNLEKLDKSIGNAVKTIDPSAKYGGMLADIQNDLPIAKWIDFAKPVGMVQANMMGGGEPVLWATVPDFTNKIKTVAAAREENGVWHVPFEGSKTVYAKVKGAHIAAATDLDVLNAATKEGKTLADELKAQADLLKDRDALIHLNFDPIRPMALMGLTQASQFAPMLAMGAAAQGGDPAGLIAVIGTLVEALKKFVEQTAYLDIAVAAGESTGMLTLAAGFKDGEIKNYLAKQKPASVPLLADMPEQPYLFAMGCHVPGSESPFFDYFFDKFLAALTGPPAPGAMPTTPPSPEGVQAAKDAMQISRDLYRKVEGWNTVMSFTPNGMRVSGDYIAADAQPILDLTKKNITTSNPLMKNFSGGASHEPLGTTKIGDATVEQYAIKFDTTNPAAAHAAQMMGANSRFYLGIAAGRVRYAMGTEEDARRVFTGKVEKPLASTKPVADAIAALPPKRNALVLIDPSGILPLLGPMMGMPKTEPLPPGPPLAVSVSISAEPARVDVHVPYEAIARMVKALKPTPPT
jgi:hypothetical protein